MQVEIPFQEISEFTDANSEIECTKCGSLYKVAFKYNRTLTIFTHIDFECIECGYSAEDEEVQEILGMVPFEPNTWSH